MPLSTRSKQLMSFEYERARRLPPEDPLRQVMEATTIRPRHQYRAHIAFKKACFDAAAAGQPPPTPADDGAVLAFRPCPRRIGAWIAEQAGTAEAPAEPLAMTAHPPWQSGENVTILVDLVAPTSRDDPPERRRAVAEETLAALPTPDATIWSDGSASLGTINGGGGALVIFHRADRQFEVQAPAGALCSSTRAEVTAIHEALLRLNEISDDEKAQIHELRVCTDSRAALELLQRGSSTRIPPLAVGV